jgi:hypothetical protein
MLSAGLFGVVIVGAFLLIFWPRQPLSDIMLTGKEPTVFFLVFAVTLVVHSYINLCCGAGDMIRKGYYIINYASEQPTYERQIGFYGYGLVEFLLHTLAVLLLFLPLMALAAFVSAVSLRTFLMAAAVLYSTSLLCRLSGFLVYLLWGRSNTLGYLTARAIMIFCVFITLIFAPAVNPLYLLHLLNRGADGTGYPFAIYMTIVMSAVLVLIIADNALVRRFISKEKG